MDAYRIVQWIEEHLGVKLEDWQVVQLGEVCREQTNLIADGKTIGTVESVTEESGGIRITGVIHDEFAHFVKGDATQYSIVEEDDEDYEEWKRHYERYIREQNSRAIEFEINNQINWKRNRVALEPRWYHNCSYFKGQRISLRESLDECPDCGKERPKSWWAEGSNVVWEHHCSQKGYKVTRNGYFRSCGCGVERPPA